MRRAALLLCALAIAPARGADMREQALAPAAVVSPHRSFSFRRAACVCALLAVGLASSARGATAVFVERKDAPKLQADFPRLRRLPAIQDFSAADKTQIAKGLAALALYSFSLDASDPLRRLMDKKTSPAPALIFLKGNPKQFAQWYVGNSLAGKNDMAIDALTFFESFASDGGLTYLMVVIDPCAIEERALEIVFHEIGGHGADARANDNRAWAESEQSAFRNALRGLSWLRSHRIRFLDANDFSRIDKNFIPNELSGLGMVRGRLEAAS